MATSDSLSNIFTQVFIFFNQHSCSCGSLSFVEMFALRQFLCSKSQLSTSGYCILWLFCIIKRVYKNYRLLFFIFSCSHSLIFASFLKKHPLFLEYLLYWYHCYFVFAEIISCIGKGYYLSILILAFWLLIKIGQSRHFITFLPCFSLSSIYNWSMLQSRFDNHLSINHSLL